MIQIAPKYVQLKFSDGRIITVEYAKLRTCECGNLFTYDGFFRIFTCGACKDYAKECGYLEEVNIEDMK